MRHALVILIAAAAVSTSALAQEAPPPETLPGPPPVIEPTPPETPTVAVPQVVAPPAPEVVAPQVVAPPPPPPPPPPPAVPTDPTTIRVLGILETVCKPLVQGGDLQALTKPLGFKKKRDVLVLALDKPYTITVTQSATNRNVCMVEIDHPIGGDKPMTVGLHDWAIARGYTLYRNDEFTTDLKRHTRSWEMVAGDKTEALVLVTSWKPDGSPLAKKADHSTLMYSIR